MPPSATRSAEAHADTGGTSPATCTKSPTTAPPPETIYVGTSLAPELPNSSSMPPPVTSITILERLLDGIDESAVPIRRLLLDRGFFSTKVLAYLRGRNLPFLMPVMFRGRKPGRGKAVTGWRTFLHKKAGWHQHILMVEEPSIRVNVCVGYKTYRHHRTGRRHNKKLVFAAAGMRETPRQICAAYRRRFGIETTYRQLGQARIRTSTRDPILRLFFVGLALVLRNLWAWLQGLLSGENPSPRQKAAAKRRQFRRLLMIMIEGIQQENAFDPLLT
jgi:Transposase DDE domain